MECYVVVCILMYSRTERVFYCYVFLTFNFFLNNITLQA